MQVIGFNFTKIAAERIENIITPSISTNIEFTNLEKDKLNILKDTEAANVSFKYTLNYENKNEKKATKQGEVAFEGKITLSINKEESKNLTKSWKKKKLPTEMKVPLFNLILRRCTPKTVFLQDEVNLPSHIPMPRIGPKKE